MIQQGTSTIYTNTIIINPNTVNITYKYGIDVAGAYGGPRIMRLHPGRTIIGWSEP